ncbi:RHS repeat-associated core domain-containing protein, partial [Pseudorhodoferax sp.]|uniref:RHS repeat-associated core domain-containing protein n=1 Tax=Pseudorhodoferax sp. TaxID=1993553 RepID=UPI002DD69BD9
WYQCDQIGAPLELTNARGDIAWAVDYKVWGEATLRALPRTGTDGRTGGHRWSQEITSSAPASRPASLEQPFRFQGQQFDEETGLHYNRFRYYDPAIGRFVSQDPIGLMGGTNSFTYAPNPIAWVDPLGLRNKRNRTKCLCEDKRTCEEIYKDALSSSIGKKETSGARGVLERVTHLLEDKLDLFRRAKSENFKGRGGSLDGVGTWDGHVEAAQNDLEIFNMTSMHMMQKVVDQLTRRCHRLAEMPQRYKSQASLRNRYLYWVLSFYGAL